MQTYIAFLRGINVSGQKKIPMAELRDALSKEPLEAIQTYIQSGNVVFKSELSAKEILEEKIRICIKNNFGFDVPVLVKTPKELEQILNQNPFDAATYLENNKVYFMLLYNVPNPEQIVVFGETSYPNEDYRIIKDCFYLLCKNGYGKAKLNNNLVERKLKVIATTRNYRSMKKLLELAV